MNLKVDDVVVLKQDISLDLTWLDLLMVTDISQQNGIVFLCSDNRSVMMSRDTCNEANMALLPGEASTHFKIMTIAYTKLNNLIPKSALYAHKGE